MAMTPTEQRAIRHYMEGSNFRLMLNDRPGFINFQDKTTGEQSSCSIAGLVTEYKEHQKEVTRQKTAEKARNDTKRRRYG